MVDLTDVAKRTYGNSQIRSGFYGFHARFLDKYSDNKPVSTPRYTRLRGNMTALLLSWGNTDMTNVFLEEISRKFSEFLVIT